MARILLVDDDDSLRDQLTRALTRRGYAVVAAAGSEEAMQCVRREPCEMAILDLRMPGESGMNLLSEILAVAPATQIVILTGFGSIASAVDALKRGAVNYVAKPAHVDEILAAFRPPSETSLETPVTHEDSPSLAQAEWEHIQRTLADCGGNISRAARRLNISRRSLQRKLRKRAPE
ncbi:MAG: response regulator [Pirellulales bacterium]